MVKERATTSSCLPQSAVDMVRARLAFANVMTACEWLDQHKDARGSSTARIIVDRQIGRSARSTLCLLWDNRWSELSSAWLHECLSFETTMLNKATFSCCQTSPLHQPVGHCSHSRFEAAFSARWSYSQACGSGSLGQHSPTQLNSQRCADNRSGAGHVLLSMLSWLCLAPPHS
jgi:hypothetical protein